MAALNSAPSLQDPLCPTSRAPTPGVGLLRGSWLRTQPWCSTGVGLRPHISAVLWPHGAQHDADAAMLAACSLQPPAAPQAAAILRLHSNLTLQPALLCMASCCSRPCVAPRPRAADTPRCTVALCCSHICIARDPDAAAVLALRRDLALQPPWHRVNTGSVCSRCWGGPVQSRAPFVLLWFPTVLQLLCPRALQCRGCCVSGLPPSHRYPRCWGGPGWAALGVLCTAWGVQSVGCTGPRGGAQLIVGAPCAPWSPPVLPLQLCSC